MVVSQKSLDDLALSKQEYKSIVNRLGREPNDLELGLFGSLWSEHCAYKHSKPLLRMLPSGGSRVLVNPGEENAGVIDIGDGLAIVMKIESHNHPSAIEPYQGAATGVGGIIRDIFAMGARPIAILNSLRFGPVSEDTNRHLFNGVIAGISNYGNCIGIPNIGGEVVFSSSYSGNPLVNAMCVGIIKPQNLIKAKTSKAGDLLMLVGADTGRDGIHGASGLASRTFEEDRELRPTVQVGNPFLEKILMEACLEIAELQSEHIEGMQDLGAAGLITACTEAAAKGKTGFVVDVSLIPRRDKGLTPYEVMLSESQERMLLIVKNGREKHIEEVFDKWGLTSTVIGKATGDGFARIFDGNTLKGEVPVSILTNPPEYKLKGTKPKWIKELQSHNLTNLPLPEKTAPEILLEILASSNITSKESVFRQYDHQVQTNTVIGPGGDAAVLRVKGSTKGIAVTTDGNGRYCHLDPYVGGIIAVAEACRNLSCVGAEPIALTDCLNFGNPERTDVYYQMEQCIQGMSLASKKLGAPVISGNVSLYNETFGESIFPTPIIGAVGLIDEINLHVAHSFQASGDLVVLLGSNDINGDPNSLAGSEYLELAHDLVAGRPNINLDLEITVQRTCRRSIRDGILKSAHDCADGGLAIALAECCISGQKGFQSNISITGRWDATLFGEYQSRIVVSLEPENQSRLEQICYEESVPWCILGHVYGDSLNLKGQCDLKLSEITNAWEIGLY